MIFGTRPRLGPVTRYVAFNATMVLCAAAAVQGIARLSTVISPDPQVAGLADVSRVEQFKQAQVAAARAPNVPVPRVIVAHFAPDVPVQVLALQLDRAESVKVKPIKLKRKPQVRLAKTTGRPKKTTVVAVAKMPDPLPEFVSSETGIYPLNKGKRPIVESPRDITNRSLGVMVALNN